MQFISTPGSSLRGEMTLPGDKSLSHRAALFAALADGDSCIDNFLVSGVTMPLLSAMTALGVAWQLEGNTLTVQGRGISAWRAPQQPIDCGNSATTLRLLAGAIAAAGIRATLTGSAGLRRRPMGRITQPLRRMGVEVTADPGELAPLHFAARAAGQSLTPPDETLEAASAQVKSCLLLAALAAPGQAVLRESGPSRDHTERMLGAAGFSVSSTQLTSASGQTIYETRLLVPTHATLPALHGQLPGDISAAAFLLVAGLIVPGSAVTVRGVGLNPTRTGLLDVLTRMGAQISVHPLPDGMGEPWGDVTVRASRLHGVEVGGEEVVRMIDEFPIFGVAAALAQGETCVRDAAELRLKESDRIAALCAELRTLGVEVEEAPDGFRVMGGKVCGGTVESHGDHRLAMALAVLGLAGQGVVQVNGAEMMNESFPEFASSLQSLGANLRIANE